MTQEQERKQTLIPQAHETQTVRGLPSSNGGPPQSWDVLVAVLMSKAGPGLDGVMPGMSRALAGVLVGIGATVEKFGQLAIGFFHDVHGIRVELAGIHSALFTIAKDNRPAPAKRKVRKS